MARPIKNKVDYFPLDIDMDADDKIYMIEAEHGLEGFAILIKLLMEIYRNGYYYDWNERTQLIFSGKRKIDLEKVLAVVESAVRCEFFSEKMYKKYGILTSHGIQSRYVLAKKRHKKIVLFRQYFLLNNNNDENAAITLEDVTKTPRKVPDITQRKGKENKEEYSSVVVATLTQKKNQPYLPLAQSLLQIQLDADDNFKPKKSLSDWANDFRLLVETDKRSIDTVKAILTWLKNGAGKEQAFWRKTVSSASGFRRNFSSMYRQYKEKGEEKKKPTMPSWICPHCGHQNSQTGSRCFQCKKDRWDDPVEDDLGEAVPFLTDKEDHE